MIFLGLSLSFILKDLDYHVYLTLFVILVNNERFELINIHGHVYVLYGLFDIILFIHGIDRYFD